MAGNAYSVTNQTPAGADLGIIALGGTAAVQIKLYELILGSDATPADLAGEFMVNRSTTTGAGGTTITPEPLNFLTAAATGTAEGGAYSTTQPVDSANSELIMIALNQRATFRWVAAPGGELIGPAVAQDGFLLRCVAHGGTPNINATIHYLE